MAQKYEQLVEEDLNVGTDRVWIHSPGGGELCSTQVGIHTFARGQQAYSASWTPGSIAAGGYAETTVTVPDAAVSDIVIASMTTMLTNSLTISAHVQVAGTATVKIYNPTSAAITVAAGTVSVLAFPGKEAASSEGVEPLVAEFTFTVTPPSGSVPFVDATTGGTPPYTWSWDFGDTKSSTSQNPTNVYDVSGTYTVTLTVTDDDSTVDSVSHDVTVTLPD